MNLRNLSLIALLAFPAMAETGWEAGLGMNYLRSKTVGDRGYSATRSSSVAPLLYVGYRAWDLPQGSVGFSLEHQFKTSYDARFLNKANGHVDTGKFRSSYLAPGVQFNFKETVDFGVGLQYRFARLETTGDSVKANHYRPWLNAYVGYTFEDWSGVRPYVALRGSVALAQTRRPSASDLAQDRNGARQNLLRSADGNADLALQMGLRF